jgi:hypothetical protein
MNTANLIAIDTHTHLEVVVPHSVRQLREYDRAADTYFR